MNNFNSHCFPSAAENPLGGHLFGLLSEATAFCPHKIRFSVFPCDAVLIVA